MTRSAIPANSAPTLAPIPVAVGRAWLVLLGGLLVGYAFLNRSFAHLGVPPLYVGELVLAAGLATAAVGGTTVSVQRSFVATALLLFMGWGRRPPCPICRSMGWMRCATRWPGGTGCSPCCWREPCCAPAGCRG